MPAIVLLCVIGDGSLHRCLLRCIDLLLNLSSLSNKLPKLHYTLYASNLSIILVNESWLDSTFNSGRKLGRHAIFGGGKSI